MHQYHPLLTLIFQIIGPCAALIASAVALGVAVKGQRERRGERNAALLAQARQVIVSFAESEIINSASSSLFRFSTGPGFRVTNGGDVSVSDVVLQVALPEAPVPWLALKWVFKDSFPLLLRAGEDAVIRGRVERSVAQVEDSYDGSIPDWVFDGDLYVDATWQDGSGAIWQRTNNGSPVRVSTALPAPTTIPRRDLGPARPPCGG